MSYNAKTAATLVVSSSPVDGDFTTIAAAIAALPAAGGEILVRNGTYPISTTITMPDKPVVIRGCGDGTIISLGANVIAAFTVPTLTAKRDFVFEDFLVTGTSVAGQKIWSLGDSDSRGILFGRRVNSSGIQLPVDITAGSGAPDNEPITINLDDCHLIPNADGSSILINMVNAIITVNAYLQRIRFYNVFGDAIAGTLTNNNINAGVNFLGEDNLFAVGTSCTVGAINLTDSVIYNFTVNPNPTITTEDDNSGLIPSQMTGCEGQFVNFALNGNGTVFEGGIYRACSFTDGAISRWHNCYFFTNPTAATSIISGVGSTFVSECRFENNGTAVVLDGNFQTISGNFFSGTPATAIIRLTNGNCEVVDNRFQSTTTPILEVTSSTNVIADNYFNGSPPSLLSTTQESSNVYKSVLTKGSFFTQTASQTVANTIVETTLFGTGIGTRTLPANYLTTGRSVRIRLYGIVSDTGTPNNTVNVKLGATTIATTGTVTFAGALANNFWFVDTIITCRTTGAAGTVFVQGAFNVEPGNFEGMPNTTTSTIDTTVAQTIDVTFTWGTASASNTITGTNGTLEGL